MLPSTLGHIGFNYPFYQDHNRLFALIHVIYITLFCNSKMTSNASEQLNIAGQSMVILDRVAETDLIELLSTDETLGCDVIS
jgi:hypothetical protein